MKTASMSTRRIRRVVLTEGCAFASAAVPRKEGYFARNVTTKVCSNLHIIRLRVPSMCGENIKTNCGSSSDKSRINEYMSDEKGRTYEGLCFCISSCAQKKRLVCSKCEDQNFLKFAQHLLSAPVNVCCKSKNELCEQFR